ncbi:hypothetical protein [Pseudoroseomonas ludipueritiae]|uniref:Uncharacterized protein n=1 Tax=Pseudoroseomonas ludipueritiae TaxID=198093 RepID=A0ABR7REP7_9PROT|nr:hypothetical protein [Pseudoroseomonas ludipueritiae]MBC9180223.1 hypothetical protein [Pseudoroseomonas ludipueritiae]
MSAPPIRRNLHSLQQSKNTLRTVIDLHEEALRHNPADPTFDRMIIAGARRDIASIEKAMAEQGYGMPARKEMVA